MASRSKCSKRYRRDPYLLTGIIWNRNDTSLIKLEIELYGSVDAGDPNVPIYKAEAECTVSSWTDCVRNVALGDLTDGTNRLRSAVGVESLQPHERDSFEAWFPTEDMELYAVSSHSLIWDHPRIAYKEALKAKENHPLVQLVRAEASLPLNEWETAISSLEQLDLFLGAASPNVSESVPFKNLASKAAKLRAEIIEEQPALQMGILKERFAKLYPDDFHRGFHWAEQWATKNDSQQALLAIETLRRLPLGQDHPWLNLLAARSFLNLGEHRKAEILARSALAETKKRGLLWHQARAHVLIASALAQQGPFARDDFEKNLYSAQQIFQRLGYQKGSAWCAELRADFYNRFEKKEALVSFLEAHSIYQDMGDEAAAISICYYLHTDRFSDETFECRLPTSEDLAKYPNLLTNTIIKVYNDGTSAHLAADFTAAKRHYQTALELFTAQGDKTYVAVALNSLGELDFLAGRFQASLDRHRDAIRTLERKDPALGEQEGNSEFLGAALVRRGLTSFEFQYGKYGIGTALLDLKRVLSYYESSASVESLIEAHLVLAEIEIFQQNPGIAQDRLLSLKDQALRLENKSILARFYSLLGKTAILQGQGSDARVFADKALEFASQVTDFRARWSADILNGELKGQEHFSEGTVILRGVAEKAAGAGALGFELKALLALSKVEVANGEEQKARCRLAAILRKAEGDDKIDRHGRFISEVEKLNLHPRSVPTETCSQLLEK